MDPYELPGVVTSMAEGAVTLAGFAAVFRAFRGEHDPDGLSRVRLNSVIEGGLLVAFICYLPAWLATAGLPGAAEWRIPSVGIVLWGALRILVPTTSILRAKIPLPEMFRSVVAAGIIAIVAAMLNVVAVTPWSPYSLFLLATMALLTNVGLIFIAQFRAEQAVDQTDEALAGNSTHRAPGA